MLMPGTINMAVYAEGMATAIPEVLADWLTENGITLNVQQAATFEDFVALMAAPTTDLGVVRNELVQTTFDNGAAKDLWDERAPVVSAGLQPSTYRDTIVALSLTSQNASMVIAPSKVLVGNLLSFSTAMSAYFGGLVFALAIDDPNSFDFEIKLKGGTGAGGNETTIKGCATQQLYLIFTGVNYKVDHVMWNKVPPAGTKSVERSGMDNEGDAPVGKTPSTATFDPSTSTANWNVPFCSEGSYTVTVTVQWTCIPTGVKSKKEKQFVVVVTGP